MTSPLRALLAGIVDYAGLFPPASAELHVAVRNYQSYRDSRDRWMLGRFVVGVAKVPELRTAVAQVRPRDAEPWPISVVTPDALAATSVLRAPDDANVRIESVELKAQTAADIALVGRAAPRHREVYVEVPLDSTTPALLDALVAAKLRAKIRTGGVTRDAFPLPDDVIAFIRACLDLDLPFKATAGLHHPLRGRYRLTYAEGADSAPMYGYLNVFLAAAFMRDGLSNADAAELLVEHDPKAIQVEEKEIRWRDRAVGIDSIRTARARGATSFGSCSFREPVDELPFPAALKAAE